MKSLTKTFGALAAGVVLTSGCSKPVLTGEYEGNRYTLNRDSMIVCGSIIEEKTDANGKTRTEVYLPLMLERKYETIEWKDYSSEEGFSTKSVNIHTLPQTATVSNSQGIVTYTANNPENKEIINKIYSNLRRGIVNVASNKTEKTQLKKIKILENIWRVE